MSENGRSIGTFGVKGGMARLLEDGPTENAGPTVRTKPHPGDHIARRETVEPSGERFAARGW